MVDYYGNKKKYSFAAPLLYWYTFDFIAFQEERKVKCNEKHYICNEKF